MDFDLSKVVVCTPAETKPSVTFIGKLLVALDGSVCGGAFYCTNIENGASFARFSETYSPKTMNGLAVFIPEGSSTGTSIVEYSINMGLLTVHSDISAGILIFTGGVKS